jgi:integrase
MKDRCRQADSGKWYARATWTDPLTGERRYKHVSAATQPKCAAALIAAIADGRAGRVERTAAMTVGDLLETWLAAKQGRVKPSSYTFYESYVRVHLTPAFGTIKLGRLTPSLIQRTYAELRQQGTSPSILTAMHRVLHNALALAERQEHIVRNPAALVEPPAYRSPEAAVWTAEQASRFLSWCDQEPMYGPLMALAVYTGMRQGELLALRWGDVDLSSGMLRVRASSYRGQIGEPKSAAGRRSIALSADALALLARHHAERQAVGQTGRDHLLFSRPDGTVLSFVTVRKRFIRGCEQASVPPIRFHGLRHTHATLMLAAGVHPKVVQERLGHSSIGITLDRYSHHVPGMQQAAAEALDATLRAKTVQNAPPPSPETA